MYKFQKTVFILTALTLLCVSHASANNLSINNVVIGQRDPSAKTVTVSFDASWSNSWRNKINHDAVWLTFRLADASGKNLCAVNASGVNPTGSSVGSSSNLEFYVPSDKLGAFLRRSSNSITADVSTTGASIKINYDSCGFSDASEITASIFGLEMVFVPQGSFYAGDFAASTAALVQGSSDSRPWAVASANAISVSNPASGGYRYVSAGNVGEYATGSAFTIPADFPKGYSAFYVMKYEITEGQWVEFVNSLPAAARLNRDITDNNHKNSDDVIKRNTISCSGSPLTCTTQRPFRPVTYLSWMDVAAFLDWDALRPATELEFEKMSRGPLLSVAGEYAWGNTSITPAAVLNSTEDGTETIADSNANYGSNVLSGGDADNGGENTQGALRAGIFASSNVSSRSVAGAGYYGAMELSGNVSEFAVTIGNSYGLAFNGDNGDGVLTTATGHEGNANTAHWPGIDAIALNGITSAEGVGLRGGSWNDASALLHISDRSQAALTTTTATATQGGRGVRTYDGN